MSLSWVQYALAMTNKELGITQEERLAFEKEKHKFCAIGDKMVKETINPNANANDLFDNLPTEQKLDFLKDVLQKGFEFIGLRKKKIEEEELEKIAETQGQQMIRNH